MGNLVSVFQSFIKFFFYLVLFILVLATFFIIMVFNLDPNKHKSSIEQAFNRETGMKLSLNGPVQTEFFPEPLAHFSKVEIINDNPKSNLSVAIGDIQLSLDLFSLFSSVVKINNASAKDVSIKLTENNETRMHFQVDSFSGQIFSSYREIVIPSFKIKRDNNVVSGDFKLTLLSQVPIVNANFNSPRFMVDFSDEKSIAANKLFSQKPLTLDWANNLNGQILWHFDNLSLDEVNIEDTDLQITFKDKIVEFSPKGKVASGDLSGKIQILKKDGEFQVTSQLQLKNAIASEFFQQFWKNAALLNGKLDIKFEGKSHGPSLAQWMAHLTGKGLINLKNMQIQDREIDTRNIDVFAAMWKSLNPNKKGTSLECAAVLLTANDGIVKANNTIALQTQDMYALGGGGISLKDETVDLTFSLYPRSQLNVEVGSLDQVVHLQGILIKPEVVKSKQGVVREGASVVLGIATGGMSILAEKLVKIVSQKSSPCQQVLAEAFEEGE